MINFYHIHFTCKNDTLGGCPPKHIDLKNIYAVTVMHEPPAERREMPRRLRVPPLRSTLPQNRECVALKEKSPDDHVGSPLMSGRSQAVFMQCSSMRWWCLSLCADASCLRRLQCYSAIARVVIASVWWRRLRHIMLIGWCDERRSHMIAAPEKGFSGLLLSQRLGHYNDTIPFSHSPNQW